jgi:hypothetical protein
MKPLEVKLTPLETFSVEIDGKFAGHFRKVDSWEGLSKLVGTGGATGGMIISDDDTRALSDMFKTSASTGPTTHTVHTISPSLIPEGRRPLPIEEQAK